MSREVTKAIKEALKKAGIDTRFISVRHKWCGYSESYHIEISSTEIDRDKVRRICNNFQKIDWDERSGEILMGGNTYIWVDYCWDIRKKAYEYDEVAA
ncbi:MAG: hypothetical protein K2L42_03200 [Clostridia bacterium]|nr:hypothetical protein [Clostridia bacterium]